MPSSHRTNSVKALKVKVGTQYPFSWPSARITWYRDSTGYQHGCPEWHRCSWFNRIRHVAPTCTPSSTWNHPTQNIYQTASRSVQPFLQSSQQTGQSVPILYNGTPFSPQNCPSHGGSRPPSTHGSLGRPPKCAPKSISTDSVAELTITTERQTNGQTTLRRPVHNHRLHLRMQYCDAA